jgi:hypothetical protein
MNRRIDTHQHLLPPAMRTGCMTKASVGGLDLPS